MKPALHRLFVKCLVLALFLNLRTAANAQHILLGNSQKVSVEAGLNFGPTFFLGDLGGNRGTSHWQSICRENFKRHRLPGRH